MASRLDSGAHALPEWPSGASIRGKWTGACFLVERRLGTGANGAVYLVRSLQGRVALKVCQGAGDVAMEWGLLEQLRKAGAAFPRPILIDDETATGAYFYAMEWVVGRPLDEALPTLSRPEFRTVLVQLFSALSSLHRTGYAFGDVKPQNILVAVNPLTARFVDVGGVTPFGRSVRQFTPFFDRAFWDLGSRRADAQYDLCGLALAVTLSLTGSPPKTLMNADPSARRKWLEKTVSRFPHADVVPILRLAIWDASASADRLAQMCASLPDRPPFGGLRRQWPVGAGSGGVTGLSATTGVPDGRPVAGAVSAGAGGSPAQTGGAVMTARVGASTAAGATVRQPSARGSGHGRRASQTGRGMDWTERMMWGSLALAACTTLLAWLTVMGWV